MFYWIYAYPSLYIGALFAVVSVAVTVLSILVVRRFFHPWIHTDERANDMVGFALSSFSVLYGLLVGLLAVAAYQNFSSVSDIVTKECRERWGAVSRFARLSAAAQRAVTR
jgi:nitrate reductase gamma subunit